MGYILYNTCVYFVHIANILFLCVHANNFLCDQIFTCNDVYVNFSTTELNIPSDLNFSASNFINLFWIISLTYLIFWLCENGKKNLNTKVNKNLTVISLHFKKHSLNPTCSFKSDRCRSESLDLGSYENQTWLNPNL